jgi:hypothetical protein
MKKYLLAAALVVASTSAMADRMVSASSLNGILFRDKAQACQDAKNHAENQKEYSEQVESYSACDCSQNNNGIWSCSVDAKLEAKNKR